MAFIIYKKEIRKNRMVYVNQDEEYSIAGWYNPVYKLWEKKGKPINEGW
jgi:hypothetical protein